MVLILPLLGKVSNLDLCFKSCNYKDVLTFCPGCTYKWFSTEEICMILERFDTVVFIGDTMLRNIYGAFNILLRQNQALGALSQWEMSDHELYFSPSCN